VSSSRFDENDDDDDDDDDDAGGINTADVLPDVTSLPTFTACLNTSLHATPRPPL